jgi:hypothetical protein
VSQRGRKGEREKGRKEERKKGEMRKEDRRKEKGRKGERKKYLIFMAYNTLTADYINATPFKELLYVANSLFRKAANQG